MILEQEFQRYGYKDILSQDNSKSCGINLDDLFEPNQIPDELLNIYISSTNDDLFFVFDSRDKNIDELTSKWDKKIRVFTLLNKNLETINKLKFNIVQLIIYSGETPNKSKEADLLITRKIIIKGEIKSKTEIIIDEDNAIELPFYMISANEFSPNTSDIAKLHELIPTEDYLLTLLQNELIKSSKGEKTYNDMDFRMIKEWLENVDSKN